VKLHRRVAEAIEQQDQNAALIAEHLESAGDLAAAYEWHMRAGAWSAIRDIAAAQLSWERALEVADALPTDTPDRMAMRIAPRTLICGTTWRRFHTDISSRFEELRDLCTQVDDKSSLAVGMAGMTIEHVLHGRVRDASRLASEYMAVVESLDDPSLTIALSFAGIVAKHETGETAEALRWTETVIDLAGKDPDKGKLIFDSPLAMALTWRGVARFRLAVPGWREDFDRASAIAEMSDKLSQAAFIAYKYAGIPRGVFLADESVLREIESALKLIERSSDDMALVLLRMTLAVAQIHNGVERARGYSGLRRLRETCVTERFAMNMIPLFDSYLALEMAERGDVDAAIQQWRTIAEGMDGAGQRSNIDLPIVLTAEQLLSRGDYDAAAREVDRLMELAGDHQWGSREIAAVRLRALLAQARGNEAEYSKLRDQYRTMADELGFEGHMAWAAEMP